MRAMRVSAALVWMERAKRLGEEERDSNIMYIRRVYVW